MTDTELLQAYVEHHSEPAFAELVNRHLGLVYASAQRQVQQPDLAADVAQAVFLLLARKAPTLRREVILSGWLFRTTRFLAARASRGETRRKHREQEATTMTLQNQSTPHDDILWSEINPHLDDAIASLPEHDRHAVLLRFFESKPLRDVGGSLGISEDSAKKRVSRAVDKLRAFLKGRGVTLSAAALTTLLLEAKAQAFPAGLAQSICGGVKTGSAVASVTVSGLVAGGLRDWLWLNVRQFAPWVGSAAALLVGTALMISNDAPPAKPVATSTPETEVAVATQSVTALIAQPAAHRVSTPGSESVRRLYLNVCARADNQPIAGARVLVHVWGTSKVNHSIDATSGADGSFVLEVPDKPFSTYRVWLSAPGYVPLVMDWRAHEFSGGDVFHTSRLTRGAVLRGEVRDEDGQPVANAKIEISGPGSNLTQRENISFHPRLSGSRTDKTGCFQLDQIPPELGTGAGDIALGISHRDFVTETFGIRNARQLATNQMITLKRGVVLVGRVVGPHDEPVVGASLQEDQAMFGIETKTDFDGRFKFSHVKPGAYTLTVRADGYSQLEKTLLAVTNSPEATLKLTAEHLGGSSKPNPLRLIGTVVDADSNEPVPHFRVLLNERRGVADRLLGESANGTFDWRTEIQFVQEFSLLLEAEGYEPQESDRRKVGDAEQKFEFRLKRGSDLTGVVLQPDGQPATNASLGLLAVGKYGLTLTDGGKLVNHGSHVNRTATDERGWFSLRTMVGAERLLVAHASGCAVLPAASVTNIVIPLQPWGQIEGAVYLGGKPAANQSVNLGFGFVLSQDGLIPFDYNTKTDADGKFRFTHVQPGTHRVQRLIKFYKGETGGIGFSHGETVTVRPAETVSVVLGGKGVAVTGRLELSPEVNNYDWSLDLHALVQQRPELPPVKWEDFHGEDRAYSRAWQVRESQVAKYYLAIEPNGSFQTDDVLPGNYDLEVVIKSVPEDPLAREAWMKPRSPIGGVKLSVVVSEAETREQLDLGIITVPITNSTPAKANAR